MLTFEKPKDNETKIKVIGVGGGGSNAVERMTREGIEGVEFYVVNTDNQDLKYSNVPNKIQIGDKVTRGLGAGAEPEMGKRAAEEDVERLNQMLVGADMVFITAGMGGGTGTGAAPVIARLAKEQNILTVGIVTKPFAFELKRRMDQAEQGIKNLLQYVDTLIIIPNQKLLEIADETTSLDNAFYMVDNVLVQAVRGISEIITNNGIINTDFADVKTTMAEKGEALMAIGSGEGKNKAIDAARAAISYPLVEYGSIAGATGLLLNFKAGKDLTLNEINAACTHVQEAIDPMANVIFGVQQDENYHDKVDLTVIATGIRKEARVNVLKNEEIVKEEEKIIKKVETAVKDIKKPTFILPSNFDSSDINYPAYARYRHSIPMSLGHDLQPDFLSRETEDRNIPAFLRKAMKD